MKPGDKVFAIFQDYEIVPVTVRNVPETYNGAYVLKENETSIELAHYFQNKWLFKTRVDAIKDCMKRLRAKMENNVNFYNKLNAQLADSALSDIMEKSEWLHGGDQTIK